MSGPGSKGAVRATTADPAPAGTRAAFLDEILDGLVAEHTADAAAVVAARKAYEERRGRVFEDEELWERWSAAFVEWYVVERVGAGDELPAAARSLGTARASDDPDAARRAAAIRAWLTSHRSLFEIRALTAGRVELLDLLGGAAISVAEQRAMHGVGVGDVAELRVIGFEAEVGFGRTFVFHPPGARDAILEHARAILGRGGDRRAVIDKVAGLRVQVERYRHVAPAKVYELGSRIVPRASGEP